MSATAPIALAFFALAAIELLYFPGRDAALHVAALRAKAVAIAELTAHSAVPALDFDDNAVLDEYLHGAARDADVVYVAACTARGDVIREVTRDENRAGCTAVTETQVEVADDHLLVRTPVAANTNPGALVIVFRTDAIHLARAQAQNVALAIAAGILMLGLGVSLWIDRILNRLQALLEENRQARARAEAASEAKSAFLANMSHEIRTPMNGVIGVTQLLERSALNDVQRRHLQTIARSGELLMSIINDILDFSKVEAGMLVIEHLPVTLHTLVADACDSVRVLAEEKGLVLSHQIDPDVPAVVAGDSVRLRQVLLNLLSNAIKFTPQGNITVRVRRHSADPTDSQLRFEVSDTGIGIEPQHHETLFEAFTQADESTTRRYGGTGLGLAICKRLVSLMQGTVGVESVLGQGSTFWFVVPLASVAPNEVESVEPPEALAQLSQQAHPSQPPATQLLAVDDNEINREVIAHLVQQLGYSVQLVEGGREAVTRVTGGERYALILMDCQMPDVDGYTATREIREWEAQRNKRRIPIVAVTAHALAGEREKVLAAGMDDYLAKPVRLNALKVMLDKWLAGADDVTGQARRA